MQSKQLVASQTFAELRFSGSNATGRATEVVEAVSEESSKELGMERSCEEYALSEVLVASVQGQSSPGMQA